MVSDTQRNRSCLLPFVLFTQSILFFTILNASLPVLTLTDLGTPKALTSPAGDENTIQALILPAAILNSSTTTQLSDNFSLTAIIPSSLSKLPANLMSCTCPCKYVTLSLKIVASPLHKNLQHLLSNMSLHLVSSEKVPLQSSKGPKLPSLNSSASTLLPNGLSPSLPQTISNKLPSPVSTSSFISKTSLLPLAKPVPISVFNESSPLPKEARFHQSRRPPLPSLPHTTAPLFKNQPFIVSWNIPDLVCQRYNISLDTSPFKGVATPAKVKRKNI